MRFETLPKQKDHNFTFVYRNRDRALITTPNQTGFGYSLSFNEIQLELSETGLANHVWGYCPREAWQITDLNPPEAVWGELRVIPDSPLVPGVAVKVSAERLPVYYDEQKRWLCLGNPLVSVDFRIKLASGLIVVGNSSVIAGLWVRVDRFEF